jgi:hypothetical protein
MQTGWWRWTSPSQVARAQAAARLAAKDGRIERGPCQRCGAAAHVGLHHPDYTRPLEVHRLCPRCHADAHLHGTPDGSQLLLPPGWSTGPGGPIIFRPWNPGFGDPEFITLGPPVLV